MSVVFRADASLQIGNGHVMRCLTLADALTASGVQCHFICREHSGNLIELLRAKGYTVHILPLGADDTSRELAHSAWLGATQAEDVSACRVILQELSPAWLVVDHYALGEYWEGRLRPFCRHLLVIDDLADRRHDCDLLLDQNLGRLPSDYLGRAPEACPLLVGPRYALLRPEFAMLREYSLRRRSRPRLRNLLVTMGGVDQSNATCQVLEALKQCAMPEDVQISVVMGPQAPWVAQVRECAQLMPWTTNVLVNISDMAQRMADSDLVIGAAGSTSWERCCLGVPTLMVVLAANQVAAAQALEDAGAVRRISLGGGSGLQLKAQLALLFSSPKLIVEMNERAAAVTSGSGCELLIDRMGLIGVAHGY